MEKVAILLTAKAGEKSSCQMESARYAQITNMWMLETFGHAFRETAPTTRECCQMPGVNYVPNMKSPRMIRFHVVDRGVYRIRCYSILVNAQIVQLVNSR